MREVGVDDTRHIRARQSDAAACLLENKSGRVLK